MNGVSVDWRPGGGSVTVQADGVFVVNVPTETGSCAVIDIAFDEARDTYSVRFSGELLDQSPEAITAAVQMTLLALRDCRP